MLLHQLRKDFVLADEPGLERGVLGLDGRHISSLRRRESRGAVLEELSLPAVELRRQKLMLVAEVRDGDVIEEMAAKDGDLLGRGVGSSCFSWHSVLRWSELCQTTCLSVYS